MQTVLAKKQVKTFGPVLYGEGGNQFRITAEARYDDQCNNGHNSFGITATIECKIGNGRWQDYSGGCCHDDVVKHFPELTPFIKWHLTSADGPMHYVANTLYWLGYSGYCDGKSGNPPNLDYARKTAVWPDMPQSFVCESLKSDSWRGESSVMGQKVKLALEYRLEALLADFAADMVKLGFTY